MDCFGLGDLIVLGELDAHPAVRRRKMNLDASAPMYMYLFLREVGQDGQVTAHQLQTLIFKLQFQLKQ